MVRLGYDPGRDLLLGEEGVVEDICDGYLASPGVDHLRHTNILIIFAVSSSPPLPRLWSECNDPWCR